MFETGEPQKAEEILDALERLYEEARLYLDAMPLDAFFEARDGKWIASDHVRHLSKSMLPLARALSLPRFVPGLLYGRFSRQSRSFVEIRNIYRHHLQQGATAGNFAPTPKPSPTNPLLRRDEILSLWRKASHLLHDGVKKWDDPAMDRYRLPHPILGRLTIREMLFFTLYHNSHHLRQVAQLPLW